MSQVPKLNLFKLFQSFQVPHVVLFGGKPSDGPQIFFFPQNQESKPGKIILVYTNERAGQYTKQSDNRIGFHQSRYRHWPPSKGPICLQTPPPLLDTDYHSSGSIFGSIQYDILCGVKTIRIDRERNPADFQMMEMKRSHDYSLLHLDIPPGISQSIELYFEISGFVVVDYHEAIYEDRNNFAAIACNCIYRETDRWYPDKSRQHKFTCYDNPFGAYTNFTIELTNT